MKKRSKFVQNGWPQTGAKRGLLKGGFTGPNPTDRGKIGIKRHILVDRLGAPIAFILATSGVHDSTLIFPTLRKFRVYRNGKILKPEILSLDKAYTGKIIKRGLRKMNVRYRIPNKTDAKQPESIPKLKPFRWTVERTIAWINAFRALKTKWEVKIENYSALFKLACAFILWRMTKW